MFSLTEQEFNHLKSQIAISSSKWGGRRHAPYVFTEQGVAMLSSVLRSKRAIEVNIAIMRTFVRLRELISSNKVLARRLSDLEKKYDGQFQVVFEARWEGHASGSCALGAEEGMEADDLLCSRNARPQKALVGRAQWKINQPSSLGR
jgi:ORF6N domain